MEHPDHQTGMVSHTMIQRRMQEEIDDLRAALAQSERKPMRDAEIVYLWEWAATAEAERTASTQQHAFARAIEKAHGIGND
jgi:hypothetical protein